MLRLCHKRATPFVPIHADTRFFDTCGSPKVDREEIIDFSAVQKEESVAMLAFLLGLFRLIWLFGKGHHGVVLENLALRQQLSIYKRTQKRPRLAGRDRWFWIALSVVWKNWRRPLCVVHPDTVVRWQREGFRRRWAHLSERSKKTFKTVRPSCQRSAKDFLKYRSPVVCDGRWFGPSASRTPEP